MPIPQKPNLLHYVPIMHHRTTGFMPFHLFLTPAVVVVSSILATLGTSKALDCGLWSISCILAVWTVMEMVRTHREGTVLGQSSYPAVTTILYVLCMALLVPILDNVSLGQMVATAFLSKI